MPRDLFGEVTRPSVSIGSRKWYTVPVSLFTHSLAVGLLIALPLLLAPAMPAVLANDDPVWIKAELPPPPPPPERRTIEKVKPVENIDAAPTTAPEGFTPEKPPIEAGWAGPGVIDGVFDPAVIIAPPVPSVQQPIRVGGTVRVPQKVRDVQPKYPPIAQQAGVQGVVIIEATIGVDGRLINAKVLRSIPLLDQAALDAVRQWEFTPSLLNGVPVPVIMTVTVNFTLTR
jgi:protein TonB